MNKSEFRLVSLFNPLVGLCVAFTQDANRYLFDEWRRLVENELDVTAKKLGDAVDLRDYDAARFAICAWVDEQVLNSTWAYRETWKGNLLQEAFYNTTHAGEEFFSRLENLRESQDEVRQVYLLCLLLGFKGRYCRDGDHIILDKIIDSTRRNRADDRAKREIKLPDTNAPLATFLRVQRIKWAVAAVLVVAVFMASYLVNDKYSTMIKTYITI